MIYKINYELPESFNKVLETAQTLGHLVFTQKMMYISTPKTKSEILDTLKSVISDTEQIMVILIDNSNIGQQPSMIISWYKDMTIRAEKERFEFENQEALRKYNSFLDAMEVELNKQLQGKEGQDAKDEGTTAETKAI